MTDDITVSPGVPEPVQRPEWDPQPMVAGPAPGLLYGGVPARFAAYLIDLLLVGAVGIVLRTPFLQARSDAGALYLSALIALVVHAAYFIWLWGTRSETLGMRALRLRLVREEDGQPIDLDRAARRFVPYAGALILLPVAWAIWLIMLITTATDARRQGIQDRLGHTIMVRRAI